MRVPRSAGALLVLIFLAAHLALLPRTLEDLDSINFALGVRQFDVARHQPTLPYQIAGIITSGPAPLISAWLFATYHSTLPIAGYIAITAVLSLVCAYFLAETFRRRLDEDMVEPGAMRAPPQPSARLATH